MQKYLEAGKVVTTHGVRGEMKLELWCDGVAFLKKVVRLDTAADTGLRRHICVRNASRDT